MALEQITAEYILNVNKAKANFESLVQAVLRGEAQMSASSRNANANITADETRSADARIRLLEQEERELQELLRIRRQTYSQEEIRDYNRRMDEARERVRQLGGETRNLQTTNRDLVGTFRNIGAAVGIAFGVQQLLSFGKELLDIGYKAKGVNKAFDAIADSRDLAALQAATGFGVADLQLKQLAVRANAFKISLETLPKLLQFATIRAAETGQEVDYLVNSIIDGIGRKSTLVIDNLGIGAAELQAEFKRTGDFAAAVGNIIDKEMGKAAITIEEAVPPTQRLAAGFENLKQKSAILLVGFIDFNKEYINTVLKVASTQENVGKAILTASTLGFFITPEDIAVADEAVKKLKEYNAEINRLLSAEGMSESELITIISQINTVLLTQAGGFTAASQALAKYNAALNALGQEAVKPIVTLESLDGELKVLKETLDKTDISSPLFSSLIAQIKALEERIENLTNPTVRGSIPYLEAQIAKLQERQQRLNISIDGNIEKYGDLQREIVELQRQIVLFQNIADPFAKVNFEAIDTGIDVTKTQLERLDEIFQALGDQIGYATKQQEKFLEEMEKTKSKLPEIETELEKYIRVQNDLRLKSEETANTLAATLRETSLSVITDLTGLFSTIGQQQSDAIIRQLDGEKARAQEHFDIMREIGQRQVENGEITKEQLFNQEAAYNEKINALEERQAAIRKQQLRRQAIAEKANASFQVIIGASAAIGKNLGNIPALIAIGIASAAQLAVIAATPIPEFAKGVVGLQGKGTATSDDIPAMLSRGESVITAKATQRHKDALDAMNKGNYDKFVQQRYIMPILQAKKEKDSQSFANNLASSMKSQGFDDTMLIHETRKNKRVTIGNAEQIGNATANALDKRRYFNNRI